MHTTEKENWLVPLLTAAADALPAFRRREYRQEFTAAGDDADAGRSVVVRLLAEATDPDRTLPGLEREDIGRIWRTVGNDWPTVRDVAMTALAPIPSISLLSLDVGVDLRATNRLVRLALPLSGRCIVHHHPAGTCMGHATTTGTLAEVAEALALAGYSVVPCLTANGRDVQCTPADRPPAGDGELAGSIAWAVQARRDNYWCRGDTLQAALTRAGWTQADLRVNGEGR